MSNLIDLYKKHINPNVDASELHTFYTSFNISLHIPHPNPKITEQDLLQNKMRLYKAEEWIYNNSKLKYIEHE